MKQYKYLILPLIMLAFFCGCSQPDSKISKDVQAKVIEIVSQMPTQDSGSADKLANELAKLNPDSTILLAKMLKPADQVNDNSALFGLNAMTNLLARNSNSRETRKYETALLYALTIIPDDTNKAFLIRQLQYVGSAKTIKTLGTLLNDQYLADYAARALLTINDPKIEKVFLLAMNSADDSCKPFIIQALGELKSSAAIPAISGYAKSQNEKLRVTSLHALAKIGDPSSKSILEDAANDADPYKRAKYSSLYLSYAARLAENGAKDLCEQICTKILNTNGVADNIRNAAKITLLEATGTKYVETGNIAPQGYASLFNGKDLTGWKLHDKLPGDNNQPKGKWFVEDNAIVGMQDPPGGGGFLTTLDTFRNFELTLETKIDWPFDSGIFLRVGPHGKSHQVTLDYRDGGEVGGIYCPWTQNFVHHCPDGVKQFKKDQWNKLRITCVGEPAHIKVWLNDKLITDFQHTAESTKNVPTEGTICLQVHPGGVGFDTSKARFRNIFIRELQNGETQNVLTAEEKKQGFVQLFNGTDLTGWVGSTNSYGVKDGVIFCRKDTGRNIYTEKEYDNFILRFDFKLEPGSNNGLGIRAPLEGDAAYVGMELQILDNTAAKYSNLHDWQYHGSIYGIYPAKRGFLNPVGQWNTEEVIANGDDIKVILNGTTIVDANLKEATKDGIISGTEHPGLFNKTGHIGFLGHGDYVEFRNIRILPLKQ